MGSVVMPNKEIRTAVIRLLMCGYNIVGNRNGSASVEDNMVVLDIQYLEKYE